MSRRPITFRIACAIARSEVIADPTVTDGEWVARMKDTAIRQGYDYPSTPEFWSRVIAALDRVVRRSSPLPLLPSVTQTSRPFTRDEARQFYQDIEQLASSLKKRGN